VVHGAEASLNQVQPLFVVGPLRAGTTFLRLILGMHPSVHIFGEFEESVALLGDSGWVPPEVLARHLETHRAFLDKRLKKPILPATYPELVLAMWAELAMRTNRPIVGASIHSRFDRCPDLWPTAKYIHVVRDPRDVARSCIGMGWVGNAYYGADIWIGAEQRWDRLVTRVPEEQLFEVRYEELVLEPERVLRSACAFMGVDYDPVMLTYPEHSTYGPPEASLVEQWRRKMKPREAQLVEWRVGEWLEARGYARSQPVSAPTPSERILLLLQNRVGRARFNVQRLGTGLWIKNRLGSLLPGTDFQRKVRLEVNDVHRKHLR